MSFPRYERYRDSGVEWLCEVPEEWDVVPIKAIASCNDDVLGESTAEDYEIEYVEISGVNSDRGITETTTIPFGQAPSRARRIVKDGDVLISTVRTYLRAIAPVKEPPENLIVSTGFAVIRPRSGSPDFLGYLFHTEYLISEVIARSVGVSYPAINSSELMRLFVPIPPLPEQRTIAAFLDHETGKIDALVAEQEKLIGLLKEKRQAVISHAVTKGLDPNARMKDSGVEWLGEVPEGWEVTRLGNLFFEASESGNDNLPILQVSIHHGVSDKELDESEMDRKVARSEDRSKYKRVQPGDLAYNMMRAWQGGFGTVTVPGQISPAYIVARPQKHIVTEFVEHVLRTPRAVEEMRRFSRGVTDFRLRLYWDEFKNIRIAVPPLEEAEKICAHIHRITVRYDSLRNSSEQSIAFLQERRTALISAAVTGKIDVRGYEAARPEAQEAV